FLLPRPPRSPRFPYTTLFRSSVGRTPAPDALGVRHADVVLVHVHTADVAVRLTELHDADLTVLHPRPRPRDLRRIGDRVGVLPLLQQTRHLSLLCRRCHL